MKTDKKVSLVIPSGIIAKGFESVFRDCGGFQVEDIMTDFSHTSEVRLKNMEADVIIIDPVVFDYASRQSGRARISELTDAAVVAVLTSPVESGILKQYDEVIDLYDDPSAVVRKLNAALGKRPDSSRVESYELSAREKEILVCVAKGMLNKEIADRYNISIHTVITHRKNITRKTGIKTVAGLTVYALLNNLIEAGAVEDLQ